METSEIIRYLALAVLLSGAVYYDLRHSRRIPNFLTFPGMLLGILVSLPEWREPLTGLAWGGALFFLPYLFRMMGAGDVKLAMAFGALTPAAVAVAAFGSMLLAAAYFTAKALKERRLRAWLNEQLALPLLAPGIVLGDGLRARMRGEAQYPVEQKDMTPFSVFYSIAAVAALFLQSKGMMLF
jgi:Flp pilus assembly protein protease CpaA